MRTQTGKSKTAELAKENGSISSLVKSCAFLCHTGLMIIMVAQDYTCGAGLGNLTLVQMPAWWWWGAAHKAEVGKVPIEPEVP